MFSKRDRAYDTCTLRVLAPRNGRLMFVANFVFQPVVYRSTDRRQKTQWGRARVYTPKGTGVTEHCEAFLPPNRL